MEKTKIIQDYCRKFNLSGIAHNFEHVHNNAQKNQVSYLDYVLELLKTEANIRLKGFNPSSFQPPALSFGHI
jgi:hypothetical protein